jgi:uncharacterized protein (TIGR01777 family)
MRIIITGGTGLIGRAMAADLADDGHEIIILSRHPSKHTFPAGVRGKQWDGKTAADWGHLADGAGAIINLAGESIAGTGLLPGRWTAARKRRILESRTNAGMAVVEAVEAAGNRPRLVIQAAGIDFYGNRGDLIITEDSEPIHSGFLSEVVPKWEDSTAAVEEMGVRRIVTRSGLVLTMEGGPLPITVLPFRFFVGGPLGGGQQWLSWIHHADEIRAIRFLMENESARGPFNLCAPNPVTYRELAKTIGRVMKRPAFIPVPAIALRLVLGETADLVLHGRRAVPSRLQELGFSFRYPEIRPALASVLK